MNIDFSLVLFVLVSFCGFLWALDSLLIKKSRTEAVHNYRRTASRGKSEDEINRAVADLSQEPLVIEYAKSFFPVLMIVFLLLHFTLTLSANGAFATSVPLKNLSCFCLESLTPPHFCD